MPRLRTAKAVASRIDLNYFKRWHPFRGTRMILSIVLAVAAVGWWGMYGTRGKTAIYNPGPVARVHAGIQNKCEVCHDADGKGGFFQTVSDNACMKCHDSAPHADTQLQFTSLASNGPGKGAAKMAPDGSPAGTETPAGAAGGEAHAATTGTNATTGTMGSHP